MDGCRVGFGRARLTPESSGGTLGWGPLGRRDAEPSPDAVDDMFATALALEDAAGERVVVVNCDLHCASAVTWRRVAAHNRIDPARLIISGTHTHAGPAQRYGARMYTQFANALPKSATSSSDRISKAIAQAVRDGLADLAPGGAAVGRAPTGGAASNRAVPAWRHYDADQRDDYIVRGPGSHVPDTAPLADRCCDPRVTVLVGAKDDGTATVALAWFAVHGTSLGAQWPTFSADLWGEARAVVESETGDRGGSRRVGFASGSAGDVSPLPLDEAGVIRSPDDERPLEQGRELARAVGSRIGTATADAISNAAAGSFTLGIGHHEWRPRAAGLPGALSGLATAGGGIDGKTDRWADVADGVDADLYRRRRWRNRVFGRAHRPKLGIDAAYSPIPLPIGLVIRLLAPRSLPLHTLRIDGHVFATVPGEPTAMAGWRIEEALLGVDGVESASIVGYAGDYGGYWATPEEYLVQRYEGASTIFGQDATPMLQRALVDLARSTH